MPLITFKTFENPVDAHLLKSKLESEGIDCFLFDENIVSVMPLYNITVGGIKLKIDDSDLKKAKEIFSEIEHTPITSEENEVIKCPNCGSEEIISGFKSFKGVKGILSLIVTFLFTIFPIYFKTVHRCKKCDIEFKY